MCRSRSRSHATPCRDRHFLLQVSGRTARHTTAAGLSATTLPHLPVRSALSLTERQHLQYGSEFQTCSHYSTLCRHRLFRGPELAPGAQGSRGRGAHLREGSQRLRRRCWLCRPLPVRTDALLLRARLSRALAAAPKSLNCTATIIIPTPRTCRYLFPHWNWNAGEAVTVWAFSNVDEVELFVNGK